LPSGSRGVGWDAAEGEGFVVAQVGLVFAEGHRDSRIVRHLAFDSRISRGKTFSGPRRRWTDISQAALCLLLSWRIAYRIHH